MSNSRQQGHATTRGAGDESSVVFNLREIMQLEHERVVAEQSAARAAEEQVARARLVSERRAAERTRAAERERMQDAERAERERAAALLRAQLDADAAERSERHRRELDHARDLERLRLERRGRRHAAFALGACAVILAGGVAAFFAVLQPRLQVARAREAEASMLAANRARELASLRERLAALDAQPPAVVPTSRTPEATRTSTSTPIGTAAKPRISARTSPQRAVQPANPAPALESMNDDDDDPLWGLEPRPESKRDRRHPASTPH